jgi:alanyl-tRNA synthetase
MRAQEIRQQFLQFFADKGHRIVASAPIVTKGDPTLMFTNAGMNQFKDYFLGNQESPFPRIADTQKCLRVSGKHNDLEEVGRDSYHHTMFEMLGNWSFGDYFKEEAIDWAWELLTKVYKLDPDRLYVSVFSGDQSDGLEADEEAANLWKKWVAPDRILYFDRKDNFWEMGDTGPCGPCSEIHIDLRPDELRQQIPGASLVNQDDPHVVEIWNLVFIQFDRKADGSLKELPAKHVDTGMGFERLCMAVQGKYSNYDTDVFTPFIQLVEKASGKTYTGSYAPDAYSDIAMRVIVDHIRAVAFAIADGQLPDSGGAGYVIRRILRRAVRYYYSFLDVEQPLLHTLIRPLAKAFADVFPELEAQHEQVARTIEGEEKTFLNTLEKGLRRFEDLQAPKGLVAGNDAFELYDTYGFPIDLTRLIAAEKGWTVDEKGFEAALLEQKERSRSDAKREVGDWTPVHAGKQPEFVGYDQLAVSDTRVLRYRTVKGKKGNQYQIELERTPFYAESGGQAGDTGSLHFGDERIRVLDTQKDNDLIIHLVERLPANLQAPVRAEVDAARRHAIEKNHTATHLMHAALHQVLGKHAVQKGQDVDAQRLRFDFAHFEKPSEESLLEIERIVNDKIRENIALDERRNVPIAEAESMGAMMLFGEKYGDAVRVITFDEQFSRELCGGTHVPATGHIGLFKIVSESGIAAGVRRIEALTAEQAEAYYRGELDELNQIRQLFKSPLNPAKNVASMLEENRKLRKEVERLLSAQAGQMKGDLLARAEPRNGYQLLRATVSLNDASALKNLAYQLEAELSPAVIVLGAEVNEKPQLLIAISKELTEKPGLHAGNLVRNLAKHIQGGGGGQPFFATAGGNYSPGLEAAIEAAGKEL